jgi:hypothetical protein
VTIPAVSDAETIDQPAVFPNPADVGFDQTKTVGRAYTAKLGWIESTGGLVGYFAEGNQAWGQITPIRAVDPDIRDQIYVDSPTLLSDGVEILLQDGITVKQQYDMTDGEWFTTSTGLSAPVLSRAGTITTFPTNGYASAYNTGLVVLGSTQAIRINNILNSSAETTVIDFTLVPSAADGFTLNLCNNATNISSNYYTQWTQSNNTTVTAGRYSATNAWQMQPISNASAQTGRITIKNSGGVWRIFSDPISIGATQPITVTVTGYHGGVTADGIYIAANGGTSFSGELRIYNLR